MSTEQPPSDTTPSTPAPLAPALACVKAYLASKRDEGNPDDAVARAMLEGVEDGFNAPFDFGFMGMMPRRGRRSVGEAVGAAMARDFGTFVGGSLRRACARHPGFYALCGLPATAPDEKPSERAEADTK